MLKRRLRMRRSSRDEREVVRKKKIRYFKPNMALVRQQMKKLKTKRGGTWRPEKGKNIIRILPPWSEEGYWYKDALRHYVPGKGKTGEGKGVIPCSANDGSRCAICDMRTKLGESAKPSRQKMADELKPSREYYVNLVDMNNADAGVQVGRLAESVINKLLEYMLEPEWGDFTDPHEGYNVILTRTGEGLKTQYDVRLSKTSTPLKTKRWLRKLQDLDKLFPSASYADTRAFLAKDEEAEEEDDEDYDYEDEDDDET